MIINKKNSPKGIPETPGPILQSTQLGDMGTWKYFVLLATSCCTVASAQTFHPCQNHTVLKDETWRTVAANITPAWGSHHCDTRIPTDWLRFDSPTGGKMLEYCPLMLHCGTVFPVWLNGTHPTVAEGQVSRKACSHVYGVCCDPSYIYTVQIVNCGAYYVYKLPRVANCNAYCIGQEKPCPAGQTSPTGYTPGCQPGSSTAATPTTTTTTITTTTAGALGPRQSSSTPGPQLTTAPGQQSQDWPSNHHKHHYEGLYAIIGVLLFILVLIIGILLFCRLTGRMDPICKKTRQDSYVAPAAHYVNTPATWSTQHYPPPTVPGASEKGKEPAGVPPPPAYTPHPQAQTPADDGAMYESVRFSNFPTLDESYSAL